MRPEFGRRKRKSDQRNFIGASFEVIIRSSGFIPANCCTADRRRRAFRSPRRARTCGTDGSLSTGRCRSGGRTGSAPVSAADAFFCRDRAARRARRPVPGLLDSGPPVAAYVSGRRAVAAVDFCNCAPYAAGCISPPAPERIARTGGGCAAGGGERRPGTVRGREF